MAKTTLIVGNGLGMAIDPMYFRLETAFNEVLKGHSLALDKHEQTAIASLSKFNSPQSRFDESHLEDMQRFLTATFEIASLESDERPWLTPTAKQLYRRIHLFLFEVARHFHLETSSVLMRNRRFQKFMDRLAEFINKNRTVNLATLNYDNLLYLGLIEREVMINDYAATRLVDGFKRTFDESNLQPWPGRDFGWYLHLHGSPLFIERERGVIKKLRESEFLNFTINESDKLPLFHIVLAPPQRKVGIISTSEVLSAYWEHLKESLSESNRVLIIGYGGTDTHLNSIIKRWVEDSSGTNGKIAVVNFINDGHEADFWIQTLIPESMREEHDLFGSFFFHHLPDILDFRFEDAFKIAPFKQNESA